MKCWENRPVEVAHLFNPAFCGEMIRLCTKSYISEVNTEFPYLLAFLVLPILLYDDTRISMDARKYSLLHVWLQSHPHLRINFAERVRELTPFTQESLTFLLQVRALNLTNEGRLAVVPYKRKGIPSQKMLPIKDFYDKADLLGKWFARAGEVTTIYVMWGIQP
jgi:hypothetical protein